MARDIRTSRYLYNDRCYYYTSASLQGNKLLPNSLPLGMFYKRDVVAFAWKRVTLNSILTSEKQYIGTIQTRDVCDDIRPGMFVKDQTGALFIVDEITSDNDDDASKEIGTRPTRVTTMILRGFE